MEHHPLTKPANERQFFSQKPIWRWLIVSLLFTIALSIRIYGINDLPLDFHAVRQYRSALIARAYYYETKESIPEWKNQVARINAQREGILEPPIVEFITVVAYRLTGGEYLWIPRLTSSLFWIIGGVFIYLIGLKIGSPDGAIVSTAFYLLLPFGVRATQSFQPDPLMVMMMIISLFAIIQYYEFSSISKFSIAAVVSALAILVKPVSLFFIFGAFVSLAIYKRTLPKSLMSLRLLVFVAVSLLPTVIYYGYGIFVAGFLQRQAQISFIPELVLQFRFWKGWLGMIENVMGMTFFIGGLFGVLTFCQEWSRAFMIGLWTGYIVYNFAFTYHNMTHDYYHLPLIPIIAFSLGPIGALILRRINQLDVRHWRAAGWAILLLAVFVGAGTSILARFRMPNFADEVLAAQTIGQIVDHSPHTILLSPYDGSPLEYHGEISGDYWPYEYEIRDERLWGAKGMDALERFDKLSLKHPYEYFIVTDLKEFEAQEDLKGLLFTRFPVAFENDEYLIFDLQNKIDLDNQ